MGVNKFFYKKNDGEFFSKRFFPPMTSQSVLLRYTTWAPHSIATTLRSSQRIWMSGNSKFLRCFPTCYEKLWRVQYIALIQYA